LARYAPDLTTRIQAFVSEVQKDIDDEVTRNRVYRDRLRKMLDIQVSDLPHVRVLRKLARNGELILLNGEQDSGRSGSGGSDFVNPFFAVRSTSWNDDESPSGSSVSGSGESMTLASHQEAVRHRAGQFAANLGLPDELSRAVKLAGLFHDEGKRDKRFQIMLHRGDRWRAEASSGEPLAKSGMDPADRAAMRRAAHASGYPPGMRHEAFSARIAEALLRHEAEAYVDAAGDVDRELVVHLISAHHGRGRPLLPPLVDQKPEEIAVPGHADLSVTISTTNTIDWNGPARFERLCEMYGIWGLALLETVVRLADIWCSARSEEMS
jgi:CRISPR-associated endonuclease/helicase Cas3